VFAERSSSLKLCYCKHMTVQCVVVQEDEHAKQRIKVICGCEEMPWWSGSGPWHEIFSKCQHHQAVIMMKDMSIVHTEMIKFNGIPSEV